MSLLAALLGIAPCAWSQAADPVLEQRVVHLTEALRCLVCQNQTIADSHADLAMDLKKQVREKLNQGLSDQAVLDFMVERYGDFVLYRPPVKASTWLLWFGPLLLLLLSLVWLWRQLRGRQTQTASPPSQAELARAAALLSPNPDHEGSQ
ncbi:MAG: cytochrome c-type biogenesis protein CcmH [Rubrivivax sp.]|nr:MAG: cytochrome c-type biogenesis protein CcmH [Rubrivivax sp.]